MLMDYIQMGYSFLKPRRCSRVLPKGETIVEVLIAIMIAGFSMGTAYAISNKSLSNAISARERGQALSIIESQISTLKYRHEKPNTTEFENKYYKNDTSITTSTGSFRHFCLNEDTTLISSQPAWGPETNLANCVRNYGGTSYQVDVAAMKTAQSTGKTEPIVYRFNVTWAKLGSGGTNVSTIYYRF